MATVEKLLESRLSSGKSMRTRIGRQLGAVSGIPSALRGGIIMIGEEKKLP